MKFKTLVGISIALIAVTTIIATTSKSENVNDDIRSSFPSEFEQSVPKLKNHLAFENADAYVTNAKTINSSHYLDELAGHVNKEYGIRDDILKFIENVIPSENIAAKEAAITYAKSNQFIYYKATHAEALKASEQQFIALQCLSKALPESSMNKENRGWIDVSRGINKLMRNTPERDKHMWDIDEKYFGWQILGDGGLSTSQLKNKCDTGIY